MLDNRKRTKIKNNKNQAWRLELASFSYTTTYRPGVDNVGSDTLTRAYLHHLQKPTQISLKYTMDCVILESLV